MFSRMLLLLGKSTLHKSVHRTGMFGFFTLFFFVQYFILRTFQASRKCVKPSTVTFLHIFSLGLSASQVAQW